MKKIENYTKTELYNRSKITQIKGRSKMSKIELYKSIVEYYKKTFPLDEKCQNMFMKSDYISAYCPKDASNECLNIMRNSDYTLITLEDLLKLDDIRFDKNKIDELSFFLNGCIYSICFEEYKPLILENEKFYGFIVPVIEDEKEDDY